MRVPKPAAGMIATTFIAGCKYTRACAPVQIGVTVFVRSLSYGIYLRPILHTFGALFSFLDQAFGIAAITPLQVMPVHELTLNHTNTNVAFKLLDQKRGKCE